MYKYYTQRQMDKGILKAVKIGHHLIWNKVYKLPKKKKTTYNKVCDLIHDQICNPLVTSQFCFLPVTRMLNSSHSQTSISSTKKQSSDLCIKLQHPPPPPPFLKNVWSYYSHTNFLKPNPYKSTFIGMVFTKYSYFKNKNRSLVSLV